MRDFSNAKSELRMRLGNEISALPGEYLAYSDEKRTFEVIKHDEFIAARNILMYFSVKKEPATHEIASAALSMGKTVAFPYCYAGGIMEARIVASLDELRPAMLGIPAPSESAPALASRDLDLVIVPALTYDSNGYRVGYGGGYYDRYLKGISAYTIGLARERLMREALPVEPHDIPVRCVITEDRVIVRSDTLALHIR